MVPTAHGQKMWTGGVFVTYQAEYQKIGILQTDCRSHISTLTQFKEAGVTPKGLTLKIPCTVKMPTVETSHRWEEVLKNASNQQCEVLLNHYETCSAECEEKLTMLHMETLNQIHENTDESQATSLEHRLEIVQEIALQNITMHRKKLAADQRKS